MKNRNALVVFSGGQDSTTCLYWAIEKFEEVQAITFNYGQKHLIELEQSKTICEKLGIKQTIIDISFLDTIVESALTSNGDVNKLNPLDLPASFVPNRNQLFITLAHSLAQKLNYNHLIAGMCETDFSGYPDCRNDFLEDLLKGTNIGSGIFGTPKEISLHTPLMYLDKADTFKLAKELNCLQEVIELSHTCYNGDRTNLHDWGYGCDTCPACELRKKGYAEYKERY